MSGPPATPGATPPDQVRRPWLPAPLAAHGLDVTAVQELSYLVVEEIVDDVALLTVSDWPAADGDGRLRFPAEVNGEIALLLDALEQQVHAGWLPREPAVGDVFAGRVDPVALASATEQALWRQPLARIVPGPLYDLRDEARKVAKLAYYAGVSDLLSDDDVRRYEMDETVEPPGPAAAVRPRVGVAVPEPPA